ncbi:MAG: polysaccharide biosynthesis/export family protein, partial [Campylobacterales bacterium]|nr:polysaccharide biosynthesis/export family protein [Campylobacterales bacterium]
KLNWQVGIMKKSFLTVVFSVLFISGCSTKEHTLFQDDNHSVSNDQNYANPPNVSYTNKISPRDRISVEVFNGEKPINASNNNSQNYLDPERGFMVSDNGTVYLPLVGHVQLAGLSESEAGELLTKAYGEYLRFPFVKLDILNQRVYVIGEVQKPGIVPVTNETVNFFEALAQAGDFTDYANRTDVKIVTYVDGGKPVIRTVDMTDVKSIQMANLILKPNDILYIPPRDIKVYNTYLKETTPLLDTIGKLLTPMVNIKYLERD